MRGPKKQWVYWINYYGNGHRNRERIDPDKRLAEMMLRKFNYDGWMRLHAAHNSPFLTSRVDTNLTPPQVKLDNIPQYRSTIETPIIS